MPTSGQDDWRKGYWRVYANRTAENIAPCARGANATSWQQGTRNLSASPGQRRCPSALPSLVIEHHSPNLNALPPRLLDVSRILKGRVRCPPRHVPARVAAFDEKDLVRPLLVLEVPPVLRGRLHSPGLALVVVVDDAGGDEVFLCDGGGVCDGQGVFVDRFDRAPGLHTHVVRQGFGW